MTAVSRRFVVPVSLGKTPSPAAGWALVVYGGHRLAQAP